MTCSKISVTILAKNGQKYLKEVLESVKNFDEVLLYDTGSTDQTIPIARQFSNVCIVEAPFEGFGPTHNKASAAAKNDWILSLDSDEVATPEMVQEISLLNLQPRTVYSFPRNNYFNGKFIKWCGWYPDRQIRLYNKSDTCFSNAQVHEAVIADNQKHVELASPMVHYSYGGISDFLSKMQVYSELFAKQNAGKKNSSMFQAIVHGFFAFFKSYVIKRGFLGGAEGFIISAYNGHTAFYKYLKLKEANQRLVKN